MRGYKKYERLNLFTVFQPDIGFRLRSSQITPLKIEIEIFQPSIIIIADVV